MEISLWLIFPLDRLGQAMLYYKSSREKMTESQLVNHEQHKSVK